MAPEAESSNETARDRSLLYSSDDGSVILVDIPRSLEESQVLIQGQALNCRIYSSEPPSDPFDLPEPRDGTLPAASPASQVADLMTEAALQIALDRVHQHHNGPFCSSRVVPRTDGEAHDAPLPQRTFVPKDARYLHGSIADLRQTFDLTAPRFDLIVMDPPWPNRSARRKSKSYQIASNVDKVRQLLTHIQVASHLEPDGLVAVWITNKSSITHLLTSPTGVFASWGVELIGEWTWLKVTTKGEPVYALDSQWRKPWEKLLIARRIGARNPAIVKSKTILAVPDLHSRKPNLRGLFREVFGRDYRGLEVFARNLSAGWWSWGDQVLKFQDERHWEKWSEQVDDSSSSQLS